jgi:Pyrimidine dimer DNA glycosylase
MRLWSIHPSYLDAKGIVALWRESLLAQKVLSGLTTGYKNHPQLIRFKNTVNPVGAISSYLRCVADEADHRGYNFDRSKIAKKYYRRTIPVTKGQLDYEFAHLLAKLKQRDPDLYAELCKVKRIKLNPVFSMVGGDVESWEVAQTQHNITSDSGDMTRSR